MIAKEAKWLKLGTISLDGTKMKANASKHKVGRFAATLTVPTQIEHADYTSAANLVILAATVSPWTMIYPPTLTAQKTATNRRFVVALLQSL